MRDDLLGQRSGCADDGVRDALPALLHGRLAGAERARVEAHVAGCAACAAELAVLRDVRGALAAGAPRLELDAIAATVRAATVPASTPALVPGARVAPAAPLAPAWAVGPAPVAGSRWRGARAWRALAATVLVAAGTAGVWLGQGSSANRATAPNAGVAVAPAARVGTPRGHVGDSSAVLASAPAPTTVRPPAASTVLASAGAALGAHFDDLSDDELQTVLDAVDGEGGLLSAEPAAAIPAVATGGL